MRKLSARIGSHAAKNTLRLAEPVAKSIKMMNGHDPKSQPAQSFVPVLPMRYRAHFDRRENRLPNRSVPEQSFCGANRMVVAHVLIHRQNDPGAFTGPHCLLGLDVVHSQRLLGENPFDALAGAS